MKKLEEESYQDSQSWSFYWIVQTINIGSGEITIKTIYLDSHQAVKALSWKTIHKNHILFFVAVRRFSCSGDLSVQPQACSGKNLRFKPFRKHILPCEKNKRCVQNTTSKAWFSFSISRFHCLIWKYNPASKPQRM